MSKSNAVDTEFVEANSTYRQLQAMARNYMEDKRYKTLVCHLVIVKRYADSYDKSENSLIRSVSCDLDLLATKIQDTIFSALDDAGYKDVF